MSIDDASAGSSSALPSITLMPGPARAAACSGIAADGSTATTSRAPQAIQARAKIPVLAPRSRTARPAGVTRAVTARRQASMPSSSSVRPAS